MGVLPLQFPEGETAESLGLTGEEEFTITGLAEPMNAGELPREVTVRAGDASFTARVRIDTPKEADYFRHGGILRYVLRPLVAGAWKGCPRTPRRAGSGSSAGRPSARWEGARREPPATLKVRRAVAGALSPVWETVGHLEIRMTRYVGRMLDRGLETEGNVKGLEHQHPDRVLYHPSAWHVLPLALRYIGVSDRDTFVDFGCGKGRVVAAAMRPFRRVIGVEIAPDLAEIARAALAARSSRHRCHDVEIVVADATRFAVPDDLTIAYLFDPFSGKTLDAVLRNIIDSLDRHPRRVRLIYVHPTAARQILATKRFRLLKVQRGGLRDWPISRAEIYESC